MDMLVHTMMLKRSSSLRYYLLIISIFFLIVDSQSFKSRHHGSSLSKRPHLFLNEFAVEIAGTSEDATRIAHKHGYINMGQVGSLDGWYTFVDRRIHKRSLQLHDRRRNRLRRLRRDVLLVERLKVLSRQKRDPVLSVTYNSPNDPSWNEMWYMHCGDVNQSSCPNSMRITDAWRAGYHGEGIVATILDDGIELSHPDLSANYDPDASKDVNDNDPDPSPRYDPSNENKHGTRCAGVVAAQLDNHICGGGVAYRASIGGIRMLDGDVTDRVEASSLNFAHNHIDIYSASWGPDDDGTTVEGPGPMARASFKHGALHGRGGKGSIFVWASGNGGHNQDSCSCDGYINSIYTIGISSVSQGGFRPWYLESCSSTLATTYSSGDSHEGKVVTTDLHSSCTHFHTGTSASAPMATGIIALMLQANPELTWRDVQHVIVRTSNPRGLHANDWMVNGAGFNVSHLFGFGLMDAAGATHVARSWQQVAEQKECTSDVQRLSREIDPNRELLVSMETRACHRRGNEVSYLEHVILRITLSHPRRGDLSIFLTSPSGTVSHILERRDFDRSKAGFTNWEFLTTHHWGENPMGVWQLEVRDAPRHYRDPSRRGRLARWQLVFYGTSQHPQPNFHFDNCAAFPQQHCHEECDGCCGASALKCRSCRHVSTLQGECVSSCSLSQFVDEETRICKPCWVTCRTCNDAGPSNCTSCQAGYTVVDGRCVRTCNQGYYLETTTQTCRVCDEICKTCQGRSSHCTSCRNAFIFVGNTCRPSCPHGSYFVSVVVGCRPCNESCRGCSRSASRCTECADGYVRYRQRCMRTCPKRHFADYQQKICRECHYRCKSCRGPRDHQCTRCHGERVLMNGRCQDTCEDAYPEQFSQNPCTLVLRYQWCGMEVFSDMCCQTCLAFQQTSSIEDDDISADDDDGYYYEEDYGDETANSE